MAKLHIRSYVRSLLSLVAVALFCYGVFLFSAQVFFWFRDHAWSVLVPQLLFMPDSGHKFAGYLPYLGHWDWIISPNSLHALHAVVSYISIPVYVLVCSVIVTVIVEKN